MTDIIENKKKTIEKKININKNITIEEIKKKYIKSDNIILLSSGKILKNNEIINCNKNNKIYCLEKINKKAIKIKIDLSLYIDKHIIMEVYNDITVLEIKLSIIDYLKNIYPFLDKNIKISMLNNIYLEDDKKIIFYNITNEFKLILEPININKNNFININIFN